MTAAFRLASCSPRPLVARAVGGRNSPFNFALETLPLARRCEMGGFPCETPGNTHPGDFFPAMAQSGAFEPFGLTRLLVRLAASSTSPAVGAVLAESSFEIESWSRRAAVALLGGPAGACRESRVRHCDSARRDQVLLPIHFVGAAVPPPSRPVAGVRSPACATSGRALPLFMAARRRFAAPTFHLQQRVTRSGQVASRCNFPRSQRRHA